MRLLVIAALALTVVAIGGAATSSGPATPTNLEVVAVTEDSITIAWGPSQPGEFAFLGSPKKNQVLVGWGPSEDSRSSVTYKVVKDSDAPVYTAEPQYLFTGIPGKTKSFRVCVTALNAAGQESPPSCGTLTRL